MGETTMITMMPDLKAFQNFILLWPSTKRNAHSTGYCRVCKRSNV